MSLPHCALPRAVRPAPAPLSLYRISSSWSGFRCLRVPPESRQPATGHPHDLWSAGVRWGCSILSISLSWPESNQTRGLATPRSAHTEACYLVPSCAPPRFRRSLQCGSRRPRSRPAPSRGTTLRGTTSLVGKRGRVADGVHGGRAHLSSQTPRTAADSCPVGSTRRRSHRCRWIPSLEARDLAVSKAAQGAQHGRGGRRATLTTNRKRPRQEAAAHWNGEDLPALDLVPTSNDDAGREHVFVVVALIMTQRR